MNIKYIGMDVHKETISIAVMNGEGKLVMESIIETKAITILQFIQGLRGDLHVTLEEGTWNLGGLVVRPPETTRHEASSVRSTEKRPDEGRQQERQDRRAQAGRSATRRISALGLPWRERPTNREGAGPQLADDQHSYQACDASRL